MSLDTRSDLKGTFTFLKPSPPISSITFHHPSPIPAAIHPVPESFTDASLYSGWQNNMSSSSSSSAPWEPLPLHRHLSTIGIGPVFVSPPSHYQLPSLVHLSDNDDDGDNDGITDEGCNQQQHQHQQEKEQPINSSKLSSSSNKEEVVVSTWEIIGDIKSTPQDFIVREIGWCPPPSSSSPPPAPPPAAAAAVAAPKRDGQQEEHNDRSYMNKYTNKRKGWRRGIAGLVEYDDSVDATADDDECIEEKKSQSKTATEQTLDEGNDKDASQMHISKKMRVSEIVKNDVDVAKDSSKVAAAPSSSLPSSLPTSTINTTESTPSEVLRQILIQCYYPNGTSTSGPEYADDVMKQLASLQNAACELIQYTSMKPSASAHGTTEGSDNNGTAASNSSDHEKNSVWISTSNLFKDDANKQSWKLLHQTLRQVYPLLKTENSSHLPQAMITDANEQDDHNDKKSKSNKNAYVCGLIDDQFFELIPYLFNPSEDLLQLYKFRSAGPVPAATVEEGSRNNRTNKRKKNRWKKGKREKQDIKDIDTNTNKACDEGLNQGKVLLRLRPELPRSERRNIHQIVTGRNNRKSEFETSTRNDVSINIEGESTVKTTSAIVVQWSRMAIQNSEKKRKRTPNNDGNTKPNIISSTDNGSSPDINVLFCTLKKEHVEHQVAIQSLMRTLKCRPGDIGLAGIKDMKAITYQFCTLRNVDIKRAQRPILDKRVNLANFVQVHNFLLDRGRLLGNQFQITIHNLRRVERLITDDESSSSWKERTIPVRKSHIDAMVSRVAKHGFINFYGEQRVGDAGHKTYVGTRSFDVGRALLQSNFSLAVDLIMEGRSSHVYNPTQEEINARKTWKKTRDARATLKEFPKSRSFMVRERDLMRGLLRYGDALEAIRTIPHNTKTFWVHAYQSLVWNKVATERVKRLGIRVVKGDLYIKHNGSGDVQVVNDPSGIDITEVVLPLPGYTVKYPSNEIGDLYAEIMRADGVQLSVKNEVEEATAKGNYRKLIQKAACLRWDIVTDKDESNLTSDTDPVVDAACVSFELSSGCYATMMLRELMVTTMARGNVKC